MTETTIEERAAEAPPPGDPAGQAMGPARIASIAVGLVVVVLVVLLALGRDTDPEGGDPLVGARTPPVTGQLVGGAGSYDIDDHRGSWVLVNFFATWCPPCVAEHPELVALDAWGRERGDVELVSVVFNDPPEVVAEFFAERGGDWPVIDNPAVPIDFRVSQVPESFLVSPAGQIVLHVPGQITAAEIERLIEEAS